MKGFDELNGTDFAVLDAIRRSESSDRSILETYSGLSWPTVKKVYLQLQESGNIRKDSDIKNDEEAIVCNQGYFLGVSVGTREIKAVFCDAQFNMLSHMEMQKMSSCFSMNKVKYLIDKSQQYKISKGRTVEPNELYFCFESYLYKM